VGRRRSCGGGWKIGGAIILELARSAEGVAGVFQSVSGWVHTGRGGATWVDLTGWHYSYRLDGRVGL